MTFTSATGDGLVHNIKYLVKVVSLLVLSQRGIACSCVFASFTCQFSANQTIKNLEKKNVVSVFFFFIPLLLMGPMMLLPRGSPLTLSAPAILADISPHPQAFFTALT